VPKIVWNTNVIDLSKELHQSSLTITGRRLDADSGPLLYWQANTAGSLDTTNQARFAITSEFWVPALGCWEIAGHFHGEDLKVVIDLQ
jgi:hypothetical protein